MENETFKIIDCTIRDGGYMNNWGFDLALVEKAYKASSKAGVEVFEIGFLSSDETLPVWRRVPSKHVKHIKSLVRAGAQVAAMLEKNTAGLVLGSPEETGIDILRIALNRDVIESTLPKITAYRKQGYTVFIQMMGITGYSNEQIADTVKMVDESNVADVITIGDSYGSLLPDRTKEIIGLIKRSARVKTGLHAHNNMQMGMANCIAAIEAGVDFVDASMLGMGRGGGNVPIELLVGYLSKLYPETYDVLPILECVDVFFAPLSKQINWGYSLSAIMSGIYECHPYYTSRMVESREYTIGQILNAVKVINKLDVIGFSDEILRQAIDETLMDSELQADHDLEKFLAINHDVRYINRHKDKAFLVLGNGPSLVSHNKAITKFAEDNKLIILGANNLQGQMVADYHVFCNQKRFDKYIDAVPDESRLLLGHWIDKRGASIDNSEDLVYYNSAITKLQIVDGVITSNCRSVSILMGAVAVVMGAKAIFFAGLDGYKTGETLFYEEDEDKDPKYLMEKHEENQRYLNELKLLAQANGCKEIRSITPTTYDF